ncbi:hypothetical protein CRG98_044645 [Punica granatum]|uniref:Uncharacterized protein n=1 Tax=Punica granatum TaxID=22663 RepID=A0A2I0HT99_PUNGR|nr:hypothetical protein CRG98_044645 [Punica granatum]
MALNANVLISSSNHIATDLLYPRVKTFRQDFARSNYYYQISRTAIARSQISFLLVSLLLAAAALPSHSQSTGTGVTTNSIPVNVTGVVLDVTGGVLGGTLGGVVSGAVGSLTPAGVNVR